MRWVAVDVETANADRASICSIGLAAFERGRPVGEWHWLIDPRAPFHPANVAVHGIEARHVQGQPAFGRRLRDIRALLDGAVAVAHSPFDRTALEGACQRAGRDPLCCAWVDTVRVARHAWPGRAARDGGEGYGLKALARLIGHEFRHHDALEDARAAGHVLAAALALTGLTLDAVIERCGRAAP